MRHINQTNQIQRHPSIMNNFKTRISTSTRTLSLTAHPRNVKKILNNPWGKALQKNSPNIRGKKTSQKHAFQCFAFTSGRCLLCIPQLQSSHHEQFHWPTRFTAARTPSSFYQNQLTSSVLTSPTSERVTSLLCWSHNW